MEPFTKALEVVARVMRDGATTHPDDEWVGRSPEYHLGRAEEHLQRWRDGDQLQDHVSHAATRLLMALTLRELASWGAGHWSPGFEHLLPALARKSRRYDFDSPPNASTSRIVVRRQWSMASRLKQQSEPTLKPGKLPHSRQAVKGRKPRFNGAKNAAL
jgi:hypothetical protein